MEKALDELYMREALKEARLAFDADEVPIGAVIVCKDKIIARAHNLTESLNDFTAHAEMQAFTSASHYLGGKYLDECTLYVSLEPCMMCGGAAFWTKLGRIVYGASDEKRGFYANRESLIHPKTLVRSGVLAEEASALLKEYFKGKR
jgi:tRNA(adenine34) deaminase